MKEKLLSLYRKYRELIVYVFFGGMTTVVNFAVYWPCYNLVHMSATVSNIIAWCAAVIFAYLTNKPFVFRSNDWSMATVIPEFSKFVGLRVGSGAIETLILWLTVDILGWNGNLWKILVSVIVVVLNYVFSKFLVFTGKGKE